MRKFLSVMASLSTFFLAFLNFNCNKNDGDFNRNSGVLALRQTSASLKSHIMTVAALDTDAARKSTANFICDGIADQIEINKAISIIGKGGSLYFLSGTYILNDSISVPSNITLEGEGISSKIQIADQWNGIYYDMGILVSNLISNDNIVEGNSNIVIRNIALYGNRDNQVLTIGEFQNGIGFNFVIGSKLENIHISGFNGTGAFFANSSNNIITGSYISDDDQGGISLTSSNSNLIEKNILENFASSASRAVLIYGGSSMNIVSGNICRNSGDENILIWVGDDNIIDGNIIDGSGDEGIELTPVGSALSCSRNILSGNRIYNSGSSGINLRGAVGNIVSGNLINESGESGIWINTGAAYNKVNGNTVGFSQYDGIFISQSANNNIIDNTLIANSQSLTTLCSQITVAESSYNNIHGNAFFKGPTGVFPEYSIKINDPLSSGNVVSNNDINDGATSTILNNGTESRIYYEFLSDHVFSHDVKADSFSVAPNGRIYLEEHDSDTFFTYNASSGSVELWVNGAKVQEWK